MTVNIDQLDSEIEIMPGAPAQRQPAQAGANAAAPAMAVAGPNLRRLIVRTLEEELQDYLRTRG